MAATRLCAAGLAAALLSGGAGAAVLPEERSDALYHSYDGGGVQVTGPSLLLRKQFGQHVSVFGNYYVDSISSASIDVVTTASPYHEERTETSVGLDYLHGSTTMNVAYSLSDESDYSARTFSLGVSQDFFGDLTTISLGYSLGSDDIGRSDEPDFSGEVDRQQYRLGVSQVLTRNLILGVNYEAITDEGLLRNPYRSVRYLADPNDPGLPALTEPEEYPNTRTSNAFALRARYHLPYRAALSGEYRLFNDTWGIDASSVELGYSHPVRNWLFDLRVRHYAQTAADFYSDLFPGPEAQNFRARDKELSTFTSRSLGATVSYNLDASGWRHIDRGSFNVSLDHIRFDYDDFRDARVQGVADGSEPLYGFSADVFQLYFSIWY